MDQDVKRIALGGAAVVALILGVLTFGNYSDGERSGQVVKYSHKGLIPGCKTWEGELVMGGLRRKDGAADTNANLFHFTVSDNAVAKKIQEKLENGEYAILEYKEPYWNLPCSTDSGYFITGVK